MRTFRLIGTVLLTAVMCAGLASCSNDEEEPEIVTTPKEYTVSLGLVGEIVDITESPLTKATSNDLYGIQVYSYPASKTIDRDTYPKAGSGNDITPYAYGLFDDISKMTVKLLEGYKYDFVVTMVVDGKTKISHDSSDSYSLPFLVETNNSCLATELTNSFTYSSFYKFRDLGKGSIRNADGDNTYKADIYYGALLDYVPQENGTLAVDMKRMVFGMKFIAENLTEGTLDIKAWGYEDTHLTITYPNTECEEILFFWSYGDVYRWVEYRDSSIDDYFDEEGCYKQKTSFTLSWVRGDGVVVPLGVHSIDVKRNKLTTVTVKMMEGSAVNGVGVGVNLEQEPMGTGASYVIEDGSVVGTTE